MASLSGRGLVHLAAALDLSSSYDERSCVEAARLAERGGLDFVTLDDTFARPGLDALSVLSRVAAATDRIGLVPVATPHTEPFHLPAGVAVLDRVSGGRAGWWTDVTTAGGEARPPGRRRTGPVGALSQETGEVAYAGVESGDRRMDGAGMPAAPFEDRVGRHRVDFRGVSSSGKAPRLPLPGPPRGRPVRVVDATDEPARRAAARYADVAIVRAVSAAQAAVVRDQLRAEAAEFGRRPEEPRVLAGLLVDLGDGEHAAEPGHGGGGPRQSARGPLYRGGPVDLAELIATWHGEGVVDGFHLTPAESPRDLERLVNGTVAVLQHRGLFRTFYPGSTLREHLGLAGPARQGAGHGRAS
ncbi:LLM class flavin-dependent oxidoreductase [Streptomyces sp. NRRL B-24085]|uniref:LLM class flavin-dependent oxidoreductase n=1 Tax=Streptomyces sp. NRRL B-24085 TaxID=1709476 RepID=UPI0006B3391A|nr:LLM class flavin-dependent oxidoreductase [Streptomyces sp. NRRL B-24085]